MGVGVDNYTYDLSMIKEHDKKVAVDYFKKWLSQQTTLDLNLKITDAEDIIKRDFMENTFIHDIEEKGFSTLDNLYNFQFPFNGPSIQDQILNAFRLNFSAALLGEPLFNKEMCLYLLAYAAENKDEKDARFEFFEFFAAQLLRTWRGRDSVLNAAEETRKHFPDSPICETSEALFPLMLAINTFIFANYFSKNNYYIELLKNTTNKNFITGDSPIINLCADYTNVKTESPNDDEWYYPITPKIAIICKNSINKNITSEIADIQQVEAYNLKIAQAATKQVYALTKEDLKEFL